MPTLIRIAIFLAAVSSLSVGAILLSRDHPLWWVALLSLVSIVGWYLLERLALAIHRVRSRRDAYDRRRVQEEWYATWRRMLLLPVLISAAFLLSNVHRASAGAPFFDLSSARAFLETVGFPIVLPGALFAVIASLRDIGPTQHIR